MKIAGWIITIFGALSFLGAALNGHNVLGPSFWLALGIFLLYRANNKENKKNDKNSQNLKQEDRQKGQRMEIIQANKSESVKNNSTESLTNIQSELSLKQREAAMCLVSFFGGFVNNFSDDISMSIFKQASVFYNIIYTPESMIKIMSKFPNSDSLVNAVLTIKNRNAKEFLLLTCYDLTKLSHKLDAYEILFNIAADMGYDSNEFNSLIKKYK